jgi:hypothetical protein
MSGLWSLSQLCSNPLIVAFLRSQIAGAVHYSDRIAALHRVTRPAGAPLKVNFDHDTIRRSVTTSGNRGTARRSSASSCPKQQANGPWPASLHRKVPDMPHPVAEAPPD